MKLRILLLSLGLLLSTDVSAKDALRVAAIEPLSGPFALVGEEFVKQLRATADRINARGGLYDGRAIEIVALDGKGNPQDSLLALNQAIDGGIRYVISNVSSVAHALSDGVLKHNTRNPAQRLLLVNMDGRDPALTEAKCNFWHVRLTYHTDMEVEFLTDYLAHQSSVQKVYLLNQDYAYGQAIQKTARELLPKKNPSIQIVGDDLIPLGKIKDFAPYAAKIRASGADSVISSNWGNDLYLLVKAGQESGLDVRYYIFNGYIPGSTTGLGGAGVGKVLSLFPWHANAEPNPYASFNAEFQKKYNSAANYDYVPAHRSVEMLARAMAVAKSNDPFKVVVALEGMSADGPEGHVWVRPEDHQIMAPLYLARLGRVGDAGVKFDVEGTGLGWKTVAKAESKELIPKLNCMMERPAN